MSAYKYHILWLVLLFLWIGKVVLYSQSISQPFAIPQVGDTLYLMQDNQPKLIRFWPFRSDSTKWDLNGVRAPYIKRTIIHASPDDPEALKGSSGFIWTGHKSKEYFLITPQSMESIGVTGIDLFGDEHNYTGYYFPHKRVRQSSFQKESNADEQCELIYSCTWQDLPAALKSQLPYIPDSIRIITSIKGFSEIREHTILDLHLHRHNTIRQDRVSILATRIETRKATLEWQDVTRFVKFPKIFRTDTIKEIAFFAPAFKEPIAWIRYKNNQELDYIRYQAPAIYKDLIVIDDFKPNLFFFPNPYTFGTLRIELLINKPGLYTLRLVNLIGAEVWRENYYLESNKTLDYSFSFLNKGTYFLIFQQDVNHVVSSKRLLILKP